MKGPEGIVSRVPYIIVKDAVFVWCTILIYINRIRNWSSITLEGITR